MDLVPKRMVDEMCQTEGVVHVENTQKSENPPSKLKNQNRHQYLKELDSENQENVNQGHFMWFPIKESQSVKTPKKFKSPLKQASANLIPAPEASAEENHAIKPIQKMSKERKQLKTESEVKSKPIENFIRETVSESMKLQEEDGIVTICKSFLNSGIMGCLDLHVLEEED
jgi:hypothetical protein